VGFRERVEASGHRLALLASTADRRSKRLRGSSELRCGRGVGTEGLDGGVKAGDDMAVVEDRDEGAMQGLVGGAGEESEEPALSLEQPAQDRIRCPSFSIPRSPPL